MKGHERLVPGWLGQSSLPPRRQHEIEGVSAKTAIALRAITEQVKEQAKEDKEGLLDRVPRRGRGLDLAAKLGPSNPGVRERDERDKLHVKQTTGDRHDDIQEALTRKSKQYEMLQSGQLRDDECQYEVDFLRKEAPASGRWRGDSPLRDELDTTGLAVGGTGGMLSADMQRERERRDWEAEQEQRRQAEERRWEHKQDIKDIHEDALERREQAEAAKRKKEEHREKLKEKLLQDKVKEMLLQKKQKAKGQGHTTSKKRKTEAAEGGGS